MRPRIEVFLTALKLGLTSFGGPIAHLGYFRAEYVTRRRWLSDEAYVDLLALCQFLPGPASSQMGIAIGTHRAGLLGGLAAWLGFTLPSAIALVAFAYAFVAHPAWADAHWVHGLKVVAVAVVAQAVWGMGRTLTPDRPRATLAIGATLLTLFFPSAVTQLVVIALGAILGWRLLPAPSAKPHVPLAFGISRGFGLVLLVVFFALLTALAIAVHVSDNAILAVFNAFYRAGALVFGGGHVVLPLLQAAVVPPGWISNADFLAGYGAAQAVPGPLFTFAAYLGAVMHWPLAGGWGALVCLVAIFLPAFLLTVGVLPFWDALRGYRPIAAALNGVNAAVVGILLAALYDPIFTSAVRSPADFALAVAAFGLLMFWRLSPIWVVLFAALGSVALAAVGA